MIWTGDFRSARPGHWLYALFAMALAVIAVIVLLTIVTKSAGRFVKDWRYIMNAYLEEQASTSGETGRVESAVQAGKPEYFTEDLRLFTFGEGTHFNVHSMPGSDYNFFITHVVNSDDSSMGKRLLPYPPQRLWCVYLDYAENQDTVIFIGYHNDLYSAEWVAHIGELAPFSADFTKLLAQLECELPSIIE